MLILMHLLHCFLATCQYLLREKFLFCPSLLTQLKATKTAFIDDHSLAKPFNSVLGILPSLPLHT